MNTENQETIADIITEARGVFDELRKHGYNVVSVDRMADIIDRVEEAHKRERDAGAESDWRCRMSNEKQETIADIVADIRAQNQGLPEDSYALSPQVCDLLSLADRIEAAEKREIADEKRISDAVVQSLRDKKLEMAGEIAAKESEIAKLNRKVYEYEKLLASSPIGLIYQLGICNRDGDVMNGIGILFTNEAERAKMPRVGHGDKFYVVPYKESEVAE